MLERAHVFHPHSWSENVLQYDYAGAPSAPQTHSTSIRIEFCEGNGGFSLRSQRLMRPSSELGVSFANNGTGFFHEEGRLCVYQRRRPEEHRFRIPQESAVTESIRNSIGCHNSRSVISFFFYPPSFVRRIGAHDCH